MADAWGGAWGSAWGVSWGASTSEEEAVVTGGYTPYSVYDAREHQRHERRLARRRKRLREERKTLRAEIKAMLEGRTAQKAKKPTVTVPEKLRKAQAKTGRLPVAQIEAASERAILADREVLAALEARRARLEAVQAEIDGLAHDLRMLREEMEMSPEEREDRESELLTILLLAI